MRKLTGPVIFSIGCVAILAACKLYYPLQPVTYPLEAASVTEGKRITMLICGPCHYNASTQDFSGKRMDDSPGILGTIYASNITRHTEAGIGNYTAGELAYLVRTGISRSGKLMPYMKRPNLSDEDLQNIIAYLQSNDDRVKASTRIPGKTRYTPVGRVGISMSKPLAYTNQPISKPQTAKKELGKYLVDNLACFHCHSKGFVSLDIKNPEKSKGYLGGGNKMKDARGHSIFSPNLTFHATGISNWTEEDLKRALRQGVSRTNQVLAFPMPLYPELTDSEIAALYTYLQSVPPINNPVRRKTQNKKYGNTGKDLYQKYDCSICHGNEGKKPFDLTQAFQKYDSVKLKNYIKNPGRFGNSRMPSFENRIPETDYPKLIDYIEKLGKQAGKERN